MPCNGNNHSPDCNCGWGGIFYLSDGSRYSLQHWQNADSHTHPNARCQHCGQQVFFYRSPVGGSVFFDELGSPWPKHECAGTPRSMSANVRTLQTSGSKRRQWPLLWKEKWPLPNKEGTGIVDTQDRLLFVRARFLSIPLWTPIWLSKHPTGTDRYAISFPRDKGDHVVERRFDAFTLKSLTVPDNAKHFQETIRTLNDGSTTHLSGTESDAQHDKKPGYGRSWMIKE
jgi:hypothetical protein